MMSDQLKQAIIDSGLPLSHIAKGAGLSLPVVSRFISEINHRDIRLERTADKLAEFLGLELASTPETTKRPAKRKKKSS